MKTPKALLLLLIGFLFVLPLWGQNKPKESEPLRTFVSTFGETIEGRIVEATASKVTITRKDGRKFTLPLEKLSEKTRKEIAAWKVEADKHKIPWLDVEVANLKRDGKDRSDYDNRAQRIQFKVTVENREKAYDLKGATLQVIGVAKGVTAKELGCCLNWSQKINLEANTEKEYTTEAGGVRYDNNGAANFGFKYHGWVVLIINAEGDIIHRKTVLPSSLQKSIDNLRNAKVGYTLDHELKPTKKSNSYLKPRY